MILENAYWKGDTIYANIEGEPYLVDTGAEISMTNKPLKPQGLLIVELADGRRKPMAYGFWLDKVWIIGSQNLLSLKDLEGNKSLAERMEELRIEPPKLDWLKEVNVEETREQRVQESDLSEKGKDKLRQILKQALASKFKNDCGRLGPEHTHVIVGGVHPPVRQYPLNPKAVEEMDQIVQELLVQGVIRSELNPVTNSPIQGVQKSEISGGGWRAVINFKALNKRTVANKASLINPQGTLKNLQVKKYKTCMDLANGFWSLPLAAVSQPKTAFTHKGKSYAWTRLPQGYKNSPNVF